MTLQKDLKMLFKDERAEKQWNNSSDCEEKQLAMLWAKVMQLLMLDEDKPVCKIANKAYQMTIGSIDGISEYKILCILDQYWLYGPELRHFWEAAGNDN